MSPIGDVTAWLKRLQASDRDAAQRLWQTYYSRLVAYVRRQLGALPRRAADEEDVALSAFDSFCRGAEQGRFPRLEDRDDLWQLLVVIARRKAADLAAYEGADRRDWRRSGGGEGLGAVIGDAPDPALAAQVADEYRRLLGLLPDDDMRRIAVAKMEGHSNEQVAALVGLSVATVERRLALIRRLWEHAGP